MIIRGSEKKMEEKKSIKVSLSTVFLILAIIAIIIMGYYIYNISAQNKIANEELNSLNTEISVLKDSVENYQQKIDSISNTLNSENNTTNNSSEDSKYSEITKTLENNDVLSITDAINNNDGTYTLKGKIITVDTSKEQITEYPFYKETGEYKQITVSSNTKCVYSLDSYEDKTDTVENVFSKKLYFGGCFNFSFENGKCTSVYEVVTGH